ncbi:GOLPH3/VPS74 family protein [Paenibacillus silvisoli]|uniref:GOLPH3/VPS74 family protein n=1 Tax=Paenibacillus silvisoli TaxID=3110539 RepID=UPI002806075E|nr:GPP34 family phosphoprotein [Paenibacillus silvisoli]
MVHSFTLAQEFVLLASDSETHKWRRPMRSYLRTYAAGAILIGLLSEEVIRVGDKGKLVVIENQYNGEAADLMMLQKLKQSSKTMKEWIQSIYMWGKDSTRLFQAVVNPLVLSGCLKEEQYRMMLLFKATRYVPSTVHKDRIIQRIRAELLENGPVTKQSALLTMMLEMSKLLKSYFSEYEQLELKKRVQRLHEEKGGEWKSIRLIRKTMEDMDIGL